MAPVSARYREIDLFRAIAILLVLGFHYFSRWTSPRFDTNLYPYGSYFAEWPVFSHGFLGVEFFFMISGFVIAMTLGGCRGIGEFAARRLARLVPAMVVCSLLTYVFVRVLVQVPFFRDEASLWNFLPSWTFSSPYFWARFLPVVDHIDGAYWSLVVEMKFYFWAACLFFWRRDRFYWVLFLFCLATAGIFLAGELTGLKSLKALSGGVFLGRYAMLFAAGALFFHLLRGGDSFQKIVWLLGICLVVELLTSGLAPQPRELIVVVIGFKLLFFAAFWAVVRGWRAPSNLVVDWLIRLGLVSYPLYLLHQNIGVGVLSHFRGMNQPLFLVGLIVALFAALVLASRWLHRFVEEPGKRLIRRMLLGNSARDATRTVAS